MFWAILAILAAPFLIAAGIVVAFRDWWKVKSFDSDVESLDASEEEMDGVRAAQEAGLVEVINGRVEITEAGLAYAKEHGILAEEKQ